MGRGFPVSFALLLGITCGLSGNKCLFADEDFSKWNSAIEKFEQSDKDKFPPPNSVLFVGSSSIRLWDLKKSFPEWKTINRGFGGSQTVDVNHFFDRIVAPYKPRIVILYEGDNDIGKGKSVDQVVDDFRTFRKLMKEKLPETHIVYLPIKPSIKRWDLWSKMDKVNKAVETIAKDDALLTYADTAAPMLKLGTPPPEKLFQKDGLHLSPEGYTMWSNIVKEVVKKIEANKN